MASIVRLLVNSIVPLLGKVSDEEFARRFGVTEQAVSVKRWRLNIPPYTALRGL